MEANLVKQARPPQNEFSRRLINIRSRMKERAMDILVIYSGPGSLRFGQRGHVMYVSGYEPYFGDTMVILPQDERFETLLELDEANHFAPATTWIENIKSSVDHVNTLKKYFQDNKLKNQKIGIVGEYSMNPLLYSRFQEEIGSNQIELASDIIESERAIKSEILGCLILVRCIMAAINTQADALVKILDSIMKTESC
jgi:Xaa-Pro aminopeptidase